MAPSLVPALHRLRQQGRLTMAWGRTNRKPKFYKLTTAGRHQPRLKRAISEARFGLVRAGDTGRERGARGLYGLHHERPSGQRLQLQPRISRSCVALA
ncbi:MAG: helix-turn-helix transcriptional regulator [Acidobacteria bacterium]|nr:helix-turn-helix transcriptional regulator [Acidobacteriota bacterium]